MAESTKSHPKLDTEHQHKSETDTNTASTASEQSLPKAAPKRNAFAQMMSSKPSKQSKTSQATTNITKKSKPNFYTRHDGRNPNDPRSGLLAYILNPESFPPNIVLRTTRHTVLIRDLYPKATIHLLLLPRSETHRNLHPHDAFADPSFLEIIKSEALSAAELAASELSRLISPFSKSCQALNSVLDSPNPPSTLPPARDFVRDLKVGIHAHPSMSHLHIHIISRDMHSDSLKHRKHYNSFNTPFFIPLVDFPLADDDDRKTTSVQNANLKRDFECWRCGRGFGNKFAQLKDHLEDEYLAWRAE